MEVTVYVAVKHIPSAWELKSLSFRLVSEIARFTLDIGLVKLVKGIAQYDTRL